MSQASQSGRKHAIVMGGSMAGLLAARVLTDYFGQVTLIERNQFPAEAEQRRGVPQGRHTHALLASGKQVLDELFPGLAEDLLHRGALTGDIGEARWFFEGGCLSRVTSGLKGLLLTRPFLESGVRDRVLANPKIARRDNLQVEGLVLEKSSGRVTGVRAGEETLSADLVVDATGRGSRSPVWLEEMGYEKPREDAVQVALAYTTRFFRRLPTDLGGDMAAIIPPTPEGKRGGVMIAQEGDRWTCTLIGHFGNHAPEELAGYVEYAKTLPGPYIHQVVSRNEPLGDAVSARFPASTRRRYELLKRFPAGYLVFGDAICSFNPIYGQGMSVSALQSIELRKALARGVGDADFAKTFFSQAAKVVDIPWAIAVGNDLRMPETVGPRNAGVKFINWYLSKLHKAAHNDPVLAVAFHKVGNLLAPPPSLFHPRITSRVLLGNLRPSRPAANAQPASESAAPSAAAETE